MKFIFKAVSFFLLLIIIPTMVYSQTVEQSAELQKLSIELKEKFEQQHSYALMIADSLNLPTRLTYKNGRTAVLVKFEDGRPVYKTNYNAEGATLINTDDVQAGPLNLSGSGQTIGIWDAGNPLLNHEQLIGRVIAAETATTDGHATHVAGTLIGSGSGNASAKGMAPLATVDSYDFLGDQGEMSGAAGVGLLLSVHPYGWGGILEHLMIPMIRVGTGLVQQAGPKIMPLVSTILQMPKVGITLRLTLPITLW